MRVPWEIAPSPSPTAPLDPFRPDPTVWPEAPGWLFPLVMVLLAVAGMVVAILLFMWRKSIVVEREQRAQKPPTDWVDLSKLHKGGRWADEESADSPGAREGREDSP